ncbi:MAG TPA: hypothetical protein VGJ70_16770 [Solirubrobacteraceae bacterium]
MHALSQLSYGPAEVTIKCSREFEIVGPSDAEALIVPGRRHPQADDRMSVEYVRRQEERAVDALAVRGDRIDFGRGIRGSDKAIAVSPRRLTRHHHDVAALRRPFALDADEFRPEVEDEVVSLAVRQRLEDANAQTNGRRDNGRLCDGAFLIGAEHRPSLVI